ncbi:ubiquitin C-terminal hydrolase Ubp14 [Cryptotrichosporon argae]
MSCTHLDELAPTLRPPSASQQVHREECTLCFDGQDDPEGVFVCLQCFNGGCLAEGRRHAYLHYEKKQHPLGVVVKRTRKEPKKRDASEPPAKRLAISAPAEEELYDYTTSIRCYGCSPVGEIIHTERPEIATVVNGIMHALSSAQRSEVKAWEEEILACEHTLTLLQEPLIIPGEVPTQCLSCNLTSNLWLCLTCGFANCGRQQFGGVGGNGHALEHFKDTGHCLGVKMGTITPEGSADIYCYLCDDAKIDPDLAVHLSTFGIEVQGQTKTEKSMTELQLEHNVKFDFSMTGDDGKELQPVFGKGLTGLKNLGNSCYMASVMQTLFALPAFRSRYTGDAVDHTQMCDLPPVDCVECQMLKLADGLVSGRYSKPATYVPPSTDYESAEPSRFQDGIRPAQFKALIGKGHEEFATMRQQDSEEFLQHLLTRLRQEAKRLGRTEDDEATNIFRFGMEQRLQCSGCKRVGYKVDCVDLASLPVEAVETSTTEDGKKMFKPVALEDSLQGLCATEQLADYACSHCGIKVAAEKTTKFVTYPDLLVLHMKKFQLVNWVPTKLDIPVMVPDTLSLDALRGAGRQDGEEELDSDAPAAAGPQFNEVALAQLEEMGFPTIRCQKALLATGNSDPQAAMTWLFEHMDDPAIDAPLPPAGGVAANEPSDDQLVQLVDMGFTRAQARKALRETNNPERAVEWLFEHPDDVGDDAPATVAPAAIGLTDIGGSATLPATYRLKAFISHKGPSVHSGHYVATIRQPQRGLGEEAEDEWVLFNDEKVAKAPKDGGEEMRGFAYLYVYERV